MKAQLDTFVKTLYPNTTQIILTLTKEDVENLQKAYTLHRINDHFASDLTYPLLNAIITEAEKDTP